MKKRLYAILLCALCAAVNVNAQDRKLWFDLQLDQTVGLTKWFDDAWINQGVNSAFATGFKARINWNFYQNFGIYETVAFHWSNAIAKNADNTQNPLLKFNFQNYYMEESDYNYGQNDIEGGGSFGIFYKLNYDKWCIIPYVGVGFQIVDVRTTDYYTLKEKGTNTKYNVKNNFSVSDHYTDQLITGGLSLEITASRKMANHTNILFSLTYNYYFEPVQFSTTVTDYYENTLISNASITGNRMHTLSLGVGISFR
jgi:hypothetical protein